MNSKLRPARCAMPYRKFATGIYLVWYPIKSDAAGNAFIGEVLAAGAKKALTLEIAIDAPDGKLGRAGLLVLNPPFTFAAEMDAALAVAAPLLRAKTRLDWLAGEGVNFSGPWTCRALPGLPSAASPGKPAILPGQRSPRP